MKNLKTRIRTAYNLGVINLARVFYYRLSIKFAFNKACLQFNVQSLKAESVFFDEPKEAITLKPSMNWLKDHNYFSKYPVTVLYSPPDWHLNPFNNKSSDSKNLPWWKISDFDSAIGDIKTVWEASRFDWVLSFTQHAACGNKKILQQLNIWLNDWLKYNPPYLGINWKCGQEASIRVMHLVMAAIILEQTKVASASLQSLIALHLERIAPTISYAISQDNNHGTSEAAALYIGGSWLALFNHKKAKYWQSQGLKWLENRAEYLIAKDGSFSQYSVNYHRLMLDTFSLVEIWRKQLSLSKFSDLFYHRLYCATNWLYQLTDPITGDAPNLGANDGANILALTDNNYRDFRVSIQLTSVVFFNKLAYRDNDKLNIPLLWLKQTISTNYLEQPCSTLFGDGGFAVLRNKNIMVLLRYPRFKFRPSQADLLHVDLWNEGQNLLRDAGTYSYNTDARWLNYFSGTQGHNTIEFDERDQMPRLGRFLYGDWLKTIRMKSLQENNGLTTFMAAYRDRNGVEHQRDISLSSTNLCVKDQFEGFQTKAILRWRLKPGLWQVNNNVISNGEHKLIIKTSLPIIRIEIVQGWESRYYLHKEEVPVLEIEVHKPGEIITEYHWNL